MPFRTYSNWNSRPSDSEEQIQPYRKYFFICEGENTEPSYFRTLIDLRKQLNIHPLVDLRLLEKMEEDQHLSNPRQLLRFAEELKGDDSISFDSEIDKMIIVFDADIYEDRSPGYDDLIREAEQDNIVGVTNPCFELFLLLHFENSYKQFIEGHETDFFVKDDADRLSHAYCVLRDITGINSKRNKNIGKLAENVNTAIEQERNINQDYHNVKGKVSSNIGSIIEMIINDSPLRPPEHN